MNASGGPPVQRSPVGVFYGWIIVAVGFAIGLLTSGLHSYTRGIFLKPMADALATSRLELSLGFTLTAGVVALTGPLAGFLIDRLRLRPLMVGFVLWTAAGHAALASVESSWQLFLALGLFFGLATFHLSGSAVPKLVINWFERRQGVALSIVAMGASMAGAVAPPIATALIEAIGWRGTLFVFALVTLVVVLPIVAVWVRDAPEPPAHLRDDDSRPRIAVTAPPEAVAGQRRTYFRTPAFWGIVLVFGLMGCNFSAISVHLFAHLTDIGIDPVRASLVLSVMAVLAALSKPAFGWLVDAADLRTAVGVALGAQIVGLALILVVDDFWRLLAAVVVFGFGYGGMVPLRNSATARSFGRSSFGEISGANRAAMAPFALIGMPLAGWIFDTYQSYEIAFEIFLGLYLVAALGVLLLSSDRS